MGVLYVRIALVVLLSGSTLLSGCGRDHLSMASPTPPQRASKKKVRSLEDIWATELRCRQSQLDIDGTAVRTYTVHVEDGRIRHLAHQAPEKRMVLQKYRYKNGHLDQISTSDSGVVHQFTWRWQLGGAHIVRIDYGVRGVGIITRKRITWISPTAYRHNFQGEHEVKIDYDSRGRPFRYTEDSGRLVTTVKYDKRDRVTHIIERVGERRSTMKFFHDCS